jgi:Uma2 family endonuclease
VLRHHRFDVDEYHRMIDAGILTEDDRVELIDGEIVEMTPIGSRHAACVDALNRALVLGLGESAWVRIQNPVTITPHSEPEPDVVVARARSEGYSNAHPEPDDVLLLIEIGDSSASFDREVKLPLYARAGIREIWLVNLTRCAIEVHREPGAEGYARCERVTGGALSPLAFPDLVLPLETILPAAD